MNRSKYILILFFLVSCGPASKTTQVTRSPEYVKCVRGDIDSCVTYAKSQPQGRDEKTTRAAIVSYQYACFQDQPEACLEIGRIYGASSLSVTTTRQRQIYKKACDEGQPEACVLFADKLSRAEAQPNYEKACEQNYGPACSRLAQIFRKNWRFSNGLEKALDLEKKACDLGDDVGCLAAGQTYFFGSGVEKDPEKARGYFEQSCNEKTGAGCEALGTIYAKGIGVQADLKKANVYYELAEKHKRVNIAQTPQSAYLIFVDACNYGDTLGCFNAGWFLAQGLEITRNITTAREFFQRACREGLSNACDRWDKISAAGATRTQESSKTEVNHLDRDGNIIEK